MNSPDRVQAADIEPWVLTLVDRPAIRQAHRPATDVRLTRVSTWTLNRTVEFTSVPTHHEDWSVWPAQCSWGVGPDPASGCDEIVARPGDLCPVHQSAYEELMASCPDRI